MIELGRIQHFHDYLDLSVSLSSFSCHLCISLKSEKVEVSQGMLLTTSSINLLFAWNVFWLENMFTFTYLPNFSLFYI